MTRSCSLGWSAGSKRAEAFIQDQRHRTYQRSEDVRVSDGSSD